MDSGAMAGAGKSGSNQFDNGIQYSGGPIIDDEPGVNVWVNPNGEGIADLCE
jgi:hypothetical protein